MIVPVNFTSDKPHLTNFFGDQHARPLYLTFVHTQADIHQPPKNGPSILVGLNPCSPKGAKSTDEAWHSAVGTELSPLRIIDITGPGSKSISADGSRSQCYLLVAAYVGDHLEQVMVAQVSYGKCPVCEIPKGAPICHSTFQPLDNSKDQHVYPELPD